MSTRYFPALFVVLWATGFIGARYAMPYIEPFLFLTIRFCLAALILMIWLFFAGAYRPSPRQAFHAALAGCLIHGVYLGAVFWAIRHGMPAGMSALVVGLQPLITALIAGLLLKERIEPRHWAGLAIGFAGVAMVLSPKLVLSADGITPATVTASLISVLAISIGTVWQKRFASGIDLKYGTTLQYIGAAFVTGIASALLETHRVIWSLPLVLSMGWLVFGLSIGAILLLMILIREGAVSKVASLFYLVPGVTAIMAYLLFRETLTPLQLAGMVLTTFGVALATAQTGRFTRRASR